MKMLVLAGGFGTRLQSEVAEVPKALAPVGRVPFLYLQIKNWIDQGLRSFVFLLHHQADLIIKFLEAEKNGLLSGCQVSWLVEPSPMDTGGAVAYAVEQLNLKENFLITNADTWIGKGIQEVVRSEAPSMAVISLSDVSRYGQVQFSDEFFVTSFNEKISGQELGWINAGLCQLKASFFSNWDGQPFSLERITFPALADQGILKAVPIQTYFIDIGIPQDYLSFCGWIKSGNENEI